MFLVYLYIRYIKNLLKELIYNTGYNIYTVYII